MADTDPALDEALNHYQPAWQAPDESAYMRRQRDLRQAQDMLTRPHELTQDEWMRAYDIVQGHNHERLRETLERTRGAAVPDDDDREDHTHD